jgi:hypothetical protein
MHVGSRTVLWFRDADRWMPLLYGGFRRSRLGMSCHAVHTDAQRTNRSGNSLASGGSRLSGMPQASTRPGLSCWFVVEPPAGIEPATPSLPSMRGRFTTPCSTSCAHMTAQVKGAVEGCGMERREVTCSAASGKFLARQSRTGLALIGQLMRSEPRSGSRRISRCVEAGIPRDPNATDGHYDGSPLPRAAPTVLTELGGHRWCG